MATTALTVGPRVFSGHGRLLLNLATSRHGIYKPPESRSPPPHLPCPSLLLPNLEAESIMRLPGPHAGIHSWFHAHLTDKLLILAAHDRSYPIGLEGLPPSDLCRRNPLPEFNLDEHPLLSDVHRLVSHTNIPHVRKRPPLCLH